MVVRKDAMDQIMPLTCSAALLSRQRFISLNCGRVTTERTREGVASGRGVPTDLHRVEAVQMSTPSSATLHRPAAGDARG